MRWLKFLRWKNQWLAVIVFFRKISKKSLNSPHFTLWPPPHHYFDIRFSVCTHVGGKDGTVTIKIELLGKPARKVWVNKADVPIWTYSHNTSTSRSLIIMLIVCWFLKKPSSHSLKQTNQEVLTGNVGRGASCAN